MHVARGFPLKLVPARSLLQTYRDKFKRGACGNDMGAEWLQFMGPQNDQSMNAKRYNPNIAEPRLQESWDAAGIYRFNSHDNESIFSIDTPPPTVSGHLHLGHVYSYSHTDFIARFRRMKGDNVFYPMGYDDNGFPTERLVEQR